MRQISYHYRNQPSLYLVVHLILACMLVMGVGLMPLHAVALHAGEQHQKDGNVIWVVHESMSSFDIHFDSSYIIAQPVGSIYNGSVTQDPYDDLKRWASI